MVYYFTSNVVNPPATIYVGKDKYESMRRSNFPPVKEKSEVDLGAHV